MRSFLHTCASCATAAGLLACGPSPQPLPPPEDLGISISAITVSDAGNGRVRLNGTEGAVTAADNLEVVSVGVAIDLQQTAPLQDGSFSIELDGAVTSLFRLQAFNAETQTEPIDTTADASGSLAEVVQTNCLVATPAREIIVPPAPIGTPSDAPLLLDNQCAGVVGVDAAGLQVDLFWEGDVPDNMVTLPTDLTTGTQLGFTITHSAQSVGPATNVLVILLNDPNNMDEQRIFTLRATGE
jgi:hypothetical protein